MKLKCDELLSSFALKFNLRLYIVVAGGVAANNTVRARLAAVAEEAGRGLHSFTFQLNLSRVSHTKTPYTP